MAKIPVIVGLGGMNAAGRSSGFHSYKRMISDVLDDQVMSSTWCDLANRMGFDSDKLDKEMIESIKQGTLVRRIDSFDPDNLLYQSKATLNSQEGQLSFLLRKSKLPDQIPESWHLEEQGSKVKVTVFGDLTALLPERVSFGVTSAANIPHGFDPGKLYNARFHPRGLKLSIYGASDLLNSLGFEWQQVLELITPDQVSVYAGSSMGQIDDCSMAGMIAAPLTGGRVSTKMMAMSFAQMPADFINSYVINSVGNTGTNMGACATFLYNLRQGMNDIQQGNARVAVVGNAEAPIVAELMEGYRVMGALAEDKRLCALDNSEKPDNRRACRPFSENAGFIMGESAQFIVLMDDELALELGANIYGSIADVFVSADANKKSISAPGVGNYITMAKATALAKAILGEDGLQQTYVQAHGTGTPQNRVTESHILNEVAKTFGIKQWPVTAVKSYVGHSMGVAAGDQLIASLGVWRYGYIPGIKTIDHIAEDVHCSNLNILTDHHFVGEQGNQCQGVIINAKGFGGNNASALVLSPEKTMSMLTKKYGEKRLAQYIDSNEPVRLNVEKADEAATEGQESMIYTFGKSVMDESSVVLGEKQVQLSEFNQAIPLPTDNPFKDYC
ncbi:MAG: Beta-ketoacyl-[acyl-carrier-protein] synthase FabY [Candidatus Celerinatantimonas neptuna]|nr:MAG: Beta-ketoacyl-[acyl-carrier-protein] synthase FabY [Candidatus Celerinatantimonas neptuna]